MLYWFELVPVVLAVIACVMCSLRYPSERRSRDRVALLLGSLCSMFLIVAQTSWWSSLRSGDTTNTWWANYVLAVFHTLTMCAFIALAWPRGRK